LINSCFICSGTLCLVKKYKKPQQNENIFGINEQVYLKTLYKCKKCNHHYNFHNFKKHLNKLYTSGYNLNSHKNIKQKFKKIINLPKNKSSNYFRVKFLERFINKKSNILDVGSGIGIFPYSMKKNGYSISCLEPDKSSYLFIKNKLKINIKRKDALNFKIPKKYNFITFNKVLEHLEIQNIYKILKHIKRNVRVYIEVPSILARKESLNRQEFFFEHYNIFSKKSLGIIVGKLNFKIIHLSDILEVNKKFTLRAVIEKK